LLSAVLCLCLVVAACGGGSSSSTDPAPAPGGQAEPSTQFLKPHGINNKAVRFGHEASAKEREEAGAVVAQSLKARAAAKFVAQCKTLNAKAIEEIPGAKGPRDCAKALEKFAKPLSSSKLVRKDTLSGPITALRVKGNRGVALYHGNDGKDYALTMAKEGGVWKISSVLTTEL
jgi:hypothetical protein